MENVPLTGTVFIKCSAFGHIILRRLCSPWSEAGLLLFRASNLL
jgi:hypothetical protein